ncbi:MAG: sodium ion-translocating decarboxylase subunit beta, partial [Clostridiales bacterium]|nr:sodium ion-translocating decarboxylase subunit beta [Clostridiales bacterium]
MAGSPEEPLYLNFIMIAIACLLVYLAIVKKFEPLLLLPIAFGMLLINIPGAHDILMSPPTISLTPGEVLPIFDEIGNIIGYTGGATPIFNELGEIVSYTIPAGTTTIGGFLYYVYQGVNLVIFPPIIFLGIGA